MRPNLLRHGICSICCWLILLSAIESSVLAQANLDVKVIDVSENAVSRNWVDRSGTFSAKAKLVTFIRGSSSMSVTLRLDSGEERILSVSELSNTDAKYAQEIYKEILQKQLKEKEQKQLAMWDEFLVAPGRFEILYVDYNKRLGNGPLRFENGPIESSTRAIVLQKDALKLYYDPSTHTSSNIQPYNVKDYVIEKKTYEHILTPENALKVAAFEIKRHLPSAQLTGKVLRVEENSVLLSVGSVHCIRPNLKLKIIRMGEAVVDLDTKKVLGNDVHEIARVQVTEVQPEFCRAKIIPDKPEDAERKRPPLQVGDLVKFDTSAGAVAMLIPSDVDGKIEEALTKELLHYKIPLVERTLLQRSVQELQQPAVDKTMKEIYRDFGKQTGASFIVGGTVIGEQIVNQPRRRPFEGSVDVQLRLIDIESGEIITVFSGKHKVD